MAQSISQEAIGATGLPGATAASRHAGATASGAPTSGTFAVGDYVVDQSGAMYVCTVAGTPGTWQLSGVSVNENIAGKNFIINGGMDIWQRGTSFSTSSGNIYTADRFCFTSGGNAATVSQVASGLTGFQYAQRVQRNSGNSGTGAMYLCQSLETINSLPLANKTVTLSFWVRAGANYSQSGSSLYVQLVTGTGTDQNVLVSYTGQASPINTVVGITTSWQRFSLTASIASTATEAALVLAQIPTGTAGANDYFDITGVQLEIAPQATPFSRAGGSIGGELALCQRYYQRIGGSYYSPENVGVGTAGTTTAGYINCPTKQVLRTGASFNAVFGASSMKIANAGGSQFAMTSASLAVAGTNAVLFSYNVASGLTAGQPVLCFITGTDAYIELNAEL